MLGQCEIDREFLSFISALTTLLLFLFSLSVVPSVLHVDSYFGFSWTSTSHLHILSPTQRYTHIEVVLLDPKHNQHFYIWSLHLSACSRIRYTTLSHRRLFCFVLICFAFLGSIQHWSEGVAAKTPSSFSLWPTLRVNKPVCSYIWVHTDTVQLRQAVWLVSLESTTSQDLGESHSWPGRPQGCISQTYTPQSSVRLWGRETGSLMLAFFF